MREEPTPALELNPAKCKSNHLLYSRTAMNLPFNLTRVAPVLLKFADVASAIVVAFSLKGFDFIKERRYGFPIGMPVYDAINFSSCPACFHGGLGLLAAAMVVIYCDAHNGDRTVAVLIALGVEGRSSRC